MRCGVGVRAAVVCCAAFGVAVVLGARWERALVIEPVDGVRLYGQSSENGPSNGATQRLQTLAGALAASYSFTNFNQDRLAIEFRLARAAWARYDGTFGYYKRDIAAIDAWHNAARQGAYKLAVKQRRGQAQLDAAMVSLQGERDAKVRDYMTARGFKLDGDVAAVDIPALVKKNGPLLNPVGQTLDRIAIQRGYASDSLIGAAASLVQTALAYRAPPAVEPDGRHTGGLLPPATALLKGWGDCDTKTALLSSILVNWPQMRAVGVAVPGHYLMGVLRIPNKGDAFVEYDGLQYVLIEPAGPAWLPPGQIAQSTLTLLEAGDGFKIEPFF